MAIRLVVTITAAPGKGDELAQAYKARCAEVMEEPGCEQFEVFQSVIHPDKLTLLERWTDQAALDVHAQRLRFFAKPPRAAVGEGILPGGVAHSVERGGLTPSDHFIEIHRFRCHVLTLRSRVPVV